MTAQLTIKDLNCGNCPKHSVKAHPICPANINMCGDDRIDDMAPSVTKERGCVSHPLALQVLAAPVIEELEKRKSEYIELHRPKHIRHAEGIGEAIALLKEGVKKP